MTPPPHPTRARAGLLQALGAYLIWGMLPLYLRLVHAVPPFEFVGWRVVFTVPICALLIAATGQGSALLAVLRRPRTLAVLAASAVFIGGNWLIYIAAIQAGHVYATSIGYYINPLVNVVLGTLFLGERLSRRQWLAVALAAVGIAPLAWAGRDALWISLSLALTFSLYGLIRKLAPVEAIVGLTVETVLLLAPAAVLIWLSGMARGAVGLGSDTWSITLLALSGVATAVPLLLFAAAARRLAYSTLGFVQFISPTIVFLLGLFVFHEPLKPAQFASFVAVWAALALFCLDLATRRGSAGDEFVTGAEEIAGLDREAA